MFVNKTVMKCKTVESNTFLKLAKLSLLSTLDFIRFLQSLNFIARGGHLWVSQQAFTCLKSTMKKTEQCVKSVQS